MTADGPMNGKGYVLRGPRNGAGWKFALISDTQGDNWEAPGKSCVDDAVLGKVAHAIACDKPDFVLAAGDLVNGWFRNGGTSYVDQYLNWKKTMEPVYGAGIKVFPVRGNHDSGPERIALPPLPARFEPPPGSLALLGDAFRKVFSEPYIPANGPPGEEGITYSFTHKNAFVVGLDQFERPHRMNYRWLEGQLASNTMPHVFVFGHEPAFQLRHLDCLAFYPKDRDAFWDLIGRAGARVYLCGHDHPHNRAMIPDVAGNPMRQVTAGTGGPRPAHWPGVYPEGPRIIGEYSNSDYHGYVLVTVEGPTVTVAWKALLDSGAPHILDSFSYVAPGISAGAGAVSGSIF